MELFFLCLDIRTPGSSLDFLCALFTLAVSLDLPVPSLYSTSSTRSLPSQTTAVSTPHTSSLPSRSDQQAYPND